MALEHAQPLDVIDARPLAGQLHEVKNHSLLKTHTLQLMRVVMAAGQAQPQHHVAGEMTIHCLEGRVRVTTPERSCELGPGQVTALPAQASHSLEALSDTSLLLTILLHQVPGEKNQGGPG